MKMKYMLLLLALCCSGNLSAQDMGLRPGDEVPDFKIAKIINSPYRSANISDFRNQLLIVDYWSIACKGCILAMPHMDSLQKEFGERIKILPVTYEQESVVTAFWKRNPYTKGLGLPSVVEDKAFHGRFKYAAMPHEVWIYRGKVIAVTTEYYVNSKNIQKVLDGEGIDFPVKNDFLNYDAISRPLFSLDTNQAHPSSVTRYAAMGDFNREADRGSYNVTGGDGIVRDTVRKTVRAYFINQSIYTSFDMLNLRTQQGKVLIKPLKLGIGANEMVWEVKDRSRYRFVKSADDGIEQDWLRKNGLCFESVNPDSGQNDQKVYQSVWNDLNRLLGLNVRWEKRKEKVSVILQNKDISKVAPLTDGVSAGDLAFALNQREDSSYVFDESKSKVLVPRSVLELKDIEAIRKVINGYGLALVEEERMVDKLVFSEVNGGLLVK